MKSDTVIVLGVVVALLYFTSKANAGGGSGTPATPTGTGGTGGVTGTTGGVNMDTYGSPVAIPCPSGVHLLMNYHPDSDTFDYTCGTPSVGSIATVDMGVTQ